MTRTDTGAAAAAPATANGGWLCGVCGSDQDVSPCRCHDELCECATCRDWRRMRERKSRIYRLTYTLPGWPSYTVTICPGKRTAKAHAEAYIRDELDSLSPHDPHGLVRYHVDHPQAGRLVDSHMMV